ncbi:MAG TPA: hypothetical protein VGQ83_06755 [Polyangia bacterium]
MLAGKARQHSRGLLPALALLGALAACDDNGTVAGPPLAFGPASDTLYEPPVGSGIEGDWFFCRTETCAELSSDGIGFRAGGLCLRLGRPAADVGDGYCMEDSGCSYLWDGQSLMLWKSPTHDAEVLTFLVTGDRAWVDHSPHWLHREAPRALGFCQIAGSD